ncbi:MAG: response regulator transcription factor [Hyphomicrobiaceae bacterium]
MTTCDGLIAIVEDDEPVRDSLDALLMAEGYTTRLFGLAQEFLASEQSDARCILLDVRLPDGDGIDILQTLIDRGLKTPIIIMTGHGDVPMAVRAMRIGAADFLEKPFEPSDLLTSIHSAIQRFETVVRADQMATEAQRRLDDLTPRESDVMKQLVLGRSNKIIAYELGLSPRTVEVHRARVMEKTSAKSLSELVRLAIAAGVEPDATT